MKSTLRVVALVLLMFRSQAYGDDIFRAANQALRSAFKITAQKTVFSGVNPANGNGCDILIEDRRYTDGHPDDLLIVGQFEETGGYEHLGFQSGPQTANLQIDRGNLNFTLTSEANTWAGRGFQQLILRNITIHEWPQVIIRYNNGTFHPDGSELICEQLKRVSG